MFECLVFQSGVLIYYRPQFQIKIRHFSGVVFIAFYVSVQKEAGCVSLVRLFVCLLEFERQISFTKMQLA